MFHKHSNPNTECEFKFSEGKGKDAWQFVGYASKFDGNDSDGDTILAGAFSDTIAKSQKPAMYINHQMWELPVGGWHKMAEDDQGLLVEGSLNPEHPNGKTAYSALKRGDMNGLSIGFRIPAGGAEDKESSHGRIIHKVDLVEISLVSHPADDSARISSVKTSIAELESLKDCEAFLRDSELFSNSLATAFVSQVKKVSMGDPSIHSRQKTAQLTDLLKSKSPEFDKYFRG